MQLEGLLSLFILAPSLANAATYYVAPSGNNANPGTQAQPFATLQKAHDVAVAGDTIYMRGGTYNLALGGQNTLTKSGSSGNPIKIFNYPGEVPILDGSSTTNQWLVPIYMDGVSWWHIKGLEIKSGPYIGIAIWGNASNNIFEQLNVHHNGRISTVGIGIKLADPGSNNLFLNNDVHHNRDITNGNSDGIQVFSSGAGNVVRGNRVWRNSDDGIDLWNSGAVTVENNWSWENGYDDALQPTGGDGNGFKLGGAGAGDGGHMVRNNISWRNFSRGFDDNAADVAMFVYNNTAYESGHPNFAFFQAVAHTLKNNISFGPSGVSLNASVQQSFNSWNLPVTVTSAGFASLNFSAMATTPRNADGSLPTTNFLHLVVGSNLIDKGTNVGIAYTGSAPDLGACEYGGSVTPPPPPPPSSLPDVVVTALSYANGVFTSTVRNQGTAATPSGIFIGVGYSVDGVFRTWGGSSTPLAAGASATVGTDGGPYTIPTGTHTIVAYVDDANRFAESNETNNTLSQSITVGGASDTTPPTVPTGLTAVASASQVSLSWNASTDNVGVTGYRVYRDGTQIAAPASNSYIDGNLAPGTYSYTVAAVDAAGNVSAQSGSVSATITPSLPDVVVTALSYANGVFTSTVRNQGTAATPSGIFIGVGYSVDGVYRTYGGTSTPLAAGASVTIGTDGGPYTIPTGTHTIVAHVDDVNRFAESNETNNQLSQSITVGLVPPGGLRITP